MNPITSGILCAAVYCIGLAFYAGVLIVVKNYCGFDGLVISGFCSIVGILIEGRARGRN